jgi:hypothetical protein
VPPGAAVVVGPRGSDADAVTAALGGLTALVAEGGILAAGAGVDVGAGWRTARLAGCAGDRRDAVLAALRVLRADGSERLGDRPAVLVALFGPAVTKRVGAAAATALHDGRFAVLHLASAASDVLGPEQLERVLALTGTDGMDREPEGLASVLAEHLGRLLGPLSKPRRLTVLLDLWRVFGEQRAIASRRRRLLEMRAREDRLADVRARYQQLVDEQVKQQASYDLGDSTRPADLARWTPQAWHWLVWLGRTMHDAFAAIVLLRAALAVTDHGVEAGIALVAPQLATAPILLTKRDKIDASRKVAGLAGLPARPGVYVRELDERLRPGGPIDARTEAFVRQRLARARDYGLVVVEAVRELTDALLASGLSSIGQEWTCEHLRQWRESVGYTAVRPPADWAQPALRNNSVAPLAQRLAERPDEQAAAVELPCDLLWYADLADAIAQIDGHDCAAVTFEEQVPTVDVDPPPTPTDPLRPPEDSLALAIAGAAQLVDLGAEVPLRPRGWRELVDGLLASTVVAEALIGSFAVPEPLRSRDGALLPGTDARLEIASDPRQLAEWAQFMGNCIAGSYYLRAAMTGQLVLAALRDADGRILANLELRATRGGWRVVQLQARFNADPDAALAEQLSAWVAGLPPKPAVRRAVAPRPRGHASVPRLQRRARAVGDLRASLVPLAAHELSAPEVLSAVDVLGQAGLGAPAGFRGLTALRRALRQDLDPALRRGLAEDAPDLITLWRATAVRPLASAIAGLDEALREHYAYVELLLGDGPLPAVPRRLGRVPEIAEARSVELVARRLRRAIGRLVVAGDPALAAQIHRHADTGLICALVLTVSFAPAVESELTRITRVGEVAVPGYPLSTLDDETGPWRRATADAEELGAGVDWSPPTPALAVPSAWLRAGGWPALWARAHRASSAAARRP